MERTFVMVKPNGVARGLTGEIIARFERRGFTLRALKAMRIDRALAERHYAEHVEKPFFESLAAFITSGPVVAMVWEGREAVTVARAMMGVTDSAQAAPGTIRGDFSSPRRRTSFTAPTASRAPSGRSASSSARTSSSERVLTR